MECFICKEQINKRNSRHIYFCAKKNNINLDKQELRFKQICFDKKNIFDKEDFKNKYINEFWSLTDFLQEYGLNFVQSQFLLKYFGIDKRTKREATSTIRTRQKYKNTCEKKYGVDNVSKSKDIQDKKKQTFLKNYGVDNIWKSEEYYSWLHDYMLENYGKKSLPNRYGKMNDHWQIISPEDKKIRMDKLHDGYKKYWKNLSDEQKNIIIQKRCKNFVHNFSSKLETRISNVLEELNIGFTRQFWINRKSFDFKINKTRIILEINGDYWHANPEIYKKDDILKFPNGIIKAGEVWKKDSLKNAIAEKYNYFVIYIWEKEMKAIDDCEFMELLLDRLKNVEKSKNQKNKENI